ncbi:hypothetical protein [Pseudomonas sp. SO81]|jgi:hypothetical protein|uniref:hypothetical protein n=1 Tax=Pseudomonas sp. SO81 TaxID=2983246 RepID=UPI0025A47DE4|nr:hypothetical protein [Pseudomonas sp. SO81]WJN58848.1 hypothetical protein OH686_08895 [Pseudomonas sp. SO81]
MQITKNSILSPIDGCDEITEPMRVLWIDSTKDSITLFPLISDYSPPTQHGLADIKTLLEKNLLIIYPEHTPSFMTRSENQISEVERNKRDAKWKIIEPLIHASRTGTIFQRGALKYLVRERATELSMTTRDIYRIIYRFWKFGMLKNGLLENRTQCGARGKERLAKNGIKLGRPPKGEGEKTYTLSGEDIRRIKITYKKYANQDKMTLPDAYDKLLSEYYVEVDPSDIGRKVLTEIGKYPSFGQFLYHGKKQNSRADVLRGKSGDIAYKKNFKVIIGTARDGLFGPAHRYEIDATIADIYLVSSINRNRVIGRPVVYGVVDPCSGMIVGLHIGLAGPSWDEAKQALFNAFTDKVYYCKLNGVEISEQEWPSALLPQEITADGGEIKSLPAEGIIEGINVNLTYAPAGRPELKAVVESHFPIVQGGPLKTAPGATDKRSGQRGQPDPRLSALFTLEEFSKIIIQNVLRNNRHALKPDLLTIDMMRDDIEPTPISIWNWSIANDRMQGHSMPRDLVYLNLLRQDDAWITRSGITYNHLHYFFENEELNVTFKNAAVTGNKKIKIYFEPHSVRHIWFKQADGKIERCFLPREDEQPFQDLRHEVIADAKQRYSYVPASTKHKGLAAKVADLLDYKDMEKNAKQEKAKLPKHTSKRAKTSDIREHRTKEKALLDNAREKIEGVHDNIVHIRPLQSTAVTATDSHDNLKMQVIDILSSLDNDDD